MNEHARPVVEKGAASTATWEQVYGSLRRIAGDVVRGERPGHTLQPTALVHEAWLRLAGAPGGVRVRGASHLVSTAVRIMRRLLVDHARRRSADKRGGDLHRVTLDTRLPADGASPAGADAVHRALYRMHAHDEESARLVELRYFEGLTLEQAAERLGVSRKTAVRRWRRAKAWLQVELDPSFDGAVASDADDADDGAPRP